MSAPGLVVFGEDWGAHPSSTQHIVARLAAERDVVWINSIGLRRPRLDARDMKRAAAKLLRMARPARVPPQTTQARPPRLRTLDPRAAPWPGNRLAALFNRKIVGAQTRAAMAHMGLARPILWASLPSAIEIVDAVPHRALVYYCGDDFSGLAGVDHEPVMALEARLAARADLILAASAPLAARFPPAKTLLAPHGVDYDLFATPAPRAQDLPQRPQGGALAGFYGALADWIDVDMLTQAASALPHWTFVFIGPVQTQAAGLARLPNVRLLGPRPHADLPSYAQHWDVSLLPFRDNAQIRACDPLKLREYLAAGPPIAATDFPALRPYADLLHIAPAPQDFQNTLLRAVKDHARNETRRARVREESWDARAHAIARALAALA